MIYKDYKISQVLKIKKENPAFYAIRDRNYRKLPKKNIVRIYLDESIYWIKAQDEKYYNKF